MEGKEIMNDTEKIKERLRQKYMEDMSATFMDFRALHEIVATYSEVCKRREVDDEVMDCLRIINQSIDGMMHSLNNRMDRYEKFILEN